MILLLLTSLAFFPEKAAAFRNQKNCRPCNLIPMNGLMCSCIEGVDDNSCVPLGSDQSLLDTYNDECECEQWTTECNAFMDSKWDQSTAELECACYLSQTNFNCKPSFQAHYRSEKDTFESLIEQQECGKSSQDDSDATDATSGDCVGEIDSMNERCSVHSDQESCESEGVSPFSDGVCDWITDATEIPTNPEQPPVVIEEPSDSGELRACCDKPRTDSGFCTMDELLEESVPTCGKCLYDQQCENFWEAYETREEGMATGLVYCCPDAKRCVDRRPTEASPHGVGCPYTDDVAGCGYGGECGGRASNDPGYPQICTSCTQSDWYNSWMDEMTCSNTEMKSLAMQLETEFPYEMAQTILALVGVAVVGFSIASFFSKPRGDHIELDQDDKEDEI